MFGERRCRTEPSFERLNDLLENFPCLLRNNQRGELEKPQPLDVNDRTKLRMLGFLLDMSCDIDRLK